MDRVDGWETTSTDEIEDQVADRIALAECLEEIQRRLEGAQSVCYDISDDMALNLKFARRIQEAYDILREAEKNIRSLGFAYGDEFEVEL